MKTLSAPLAAHLQSGVTTLSWCWRLTRRDGVTMGFTDHDRALHFEGTTFEAVSGFSASAIDETVGLSVDNLEVTGALSSQALREDALSAGLFDDAKLELFRVNWADVSQRALMRSGSLGEVTRAGGAFTAEVRGLAHYLQQPRGRVFQYSCDADLGDARCGVDVAQAAFRGVGVVTEVASQRRVSASGLAAFAEGWFQRGLLTWTQGANAGLSIEVKSHMLANGTATLALWQTMTYEIAVGDGFAVSAGCDKAFTTCRDRFSNAINFRGFPHIPGNDYLARRAASGDDANDGEVIQ
ncbi:MAG: DUF2163 domain-containing protein [Pseudomonadota bacterium]